MPCLLSSTRSERPEARHLAGAVSATGAPRRAYLTARPGTGRSTGPTMRVDELRHLLDGVPDTRELVIRRAGTWAPERDAWRDAHDDAAVAYRAWTRDRTPVGYAAYRAAQD